jgi:cytochrome c2
MRHNPRSIHRSDRVALLASIAMAWACLAAGSAAAQGGASAGATLFTARCAACHSLKPTRKPGPILSGVYGRRAGSVAGYGYSPALKSAGQAGLVWNAKTLDRWLAGPPAYIPGVNMQAQVDSPTDRRNLIASLRTISPGRPTPAR